MSDKIVPLISNEKEFNEVDNIEGIFDDLISANLESTMDSYNDKSDQENQDSNSSCNVPSASSTENIENDANKAIYNLLTDTDIRVGLSEPAAHGSRNIKRLLKDLHPHREKPSKDRSRRFQAAALYGDQLTPAVGLR